MLVAIGAVTGLAWWDDQREANAALADLASEQSVVAASLASTLRARLALAERGSVPLDPAAAPADLIEPARGLGPGELMVLLLPPGRDSFLAPGGRMVDSAPLRDALARGLPALRLDRPEAAHVGLPERTAMAGIARVDTGQGAWGVVAVASAARERDREKRASARLVLGVLVASGLVVAFGGLALRQQRKQLGLERELAVAEAIRAGEGTLARAQRAATMGTFAIGIAHEVSSPLAVIVGRTEQLLAKVEGDERATNAAQIIMKQADRIQHIVRRFLDMARGGPLSLEVVDPSEIARAAAGSVEHRFVQAGVALARDIPSEMPAVQCDRGLLEQAVVNLLINACDACRPGDGVELSVRSDASRVAFVVRDEGTGITPEQAARATEPFFTTKPEGRGTGLGLAIASEIAKSHRGDLTIGPGSGGGTRACVEIPIAAAAAPQAQPLAG
jgi:signal transduction histidine kinase